MAHRYVVQDIEGNITVVTLDDNETMTALLKKVSKPISMIVPAEEYKGTTYEYSVLMPVRKKEAIHCNLLRERIEAVRR